MSGLIRGIIINDAVRFLGVEDPRDVGLPIRGVLWVRKVVQRQVDILLVLEGLREEAIALLLVRIIIIIFFVPVDLEFEVLRPDTAVNLG